jgi:hypothetical protein
MCVIAKPSASAASAGVGIVSSASARDHRLHLLLVGLAVAGDRELHLRRCVLGDVAPRAGSGEQHDAGRLADRHRRAGVGVEEHALDGDRVGAMDVDQRAHLVVEHREPRRDLAGRRADRSVTHGPHRAAGSFDDPVPGAGQAGVEPQHSHDPRLWGPSDRSTELEVTSCA